MMTYEEALEYIHGATRTGARDGFARMERMLELLDNPHHKLKYIHVAGTNGKGSTATMTSNILTRAGYKTGLFISPYVIDFRERIQLNGEMIPKAELANAVETLKPYFEQVKGEISECTEFELDTVIALWWYAKQGCDYVVLEAGIGGLNDKTNVIPAPAVAVLTSISFDHTHILGTTIPAIAANKAGIIKPGCRVALYCDLPQEALEAIKPQCDACGVVPNIPDRDLLEDLVVGPTGSDFVYKGKAYHVPLIGRHQVWNALTVLAVCEELVKQGLDLPYETIRDAIADTRFVGRCEVLREDPLCIIDGAHNIDGAQALCRVIDEVMQGRYITIVMGMLEDKDYKESIAMVAKRADRFIAVTPDSYRSLPSLRAAITALPHCKNTVIMNKPADGALHALTTAREDEVIIACGSLYMIGDVKQALLAQPE